jgi:hypothetical protein
MPPTLKIHYSDDLAVVVEYAPVLPISILKPVPEDLPPCRVMVLA